MRAVGTRWVSRGPVSTAIAEMMKFVNHMTALEVRPRSVLEPFVLLLAGCALVFKLRDVRTRHKGLFTGAREHHQADVCVRFSLCQQMWHGLPHVH